MADDEEPSAATGGPGSFGAWIKLSREILGMTQGELAAKVGISGAMASHIESDKRQVGDELLPKLANVLGQDLEQLARLQTASSAKRRFAENESAGSFWSSVLSEAVQGSAVEALAGAAVVKGVQVHYKIKQKSAAKRVAKATAAAEEERYKVLLDTNLLATFLAGGAQPPEGRMRTMAEVVQQLSNLNEAELNKISGYIGALIEAKGRPAADMFWAPGAIQVAGLLAHEKD